MGVPTKNFGLSNYRQKTASDLIIRSAISNLSVILPGFVTDFTQTFSSNWNQEDVYGRVDPIATFQGTRRQISLSLTIPSGDIGEASNNFYKCGDIAKLLYPAYMDIHVPKRQSSQGNQQKGSSSPQPAKKKKAPKKAKKMQGRVISKSPLVKIEYANLIKSSDTKGGGLLGYITDFSWNPQIDMGYFTDNKKMFPKVITLSLTFNVLHLHDVGFNDKGTPYSNTFPF